MANMEKIHLRKCFEAQGRRCAECLRTFKDFDHMMFSSIGFVCFDCLIEEIERIYQVQIKINTKQI